MANLKRLTSQLDSKLSPPPQKKKGSWLVWVVGLLALVCVGLLILPIVFFGAVSPSPAPAPSPVPPTSRPLDGIAVPADEFVYLFSSRYGFSDFRMNPARTMMMSNGDDGIWAQLDLNPQDSTDVVRAAALVRLEGISSGRQQDYYNLMHRMLKLAVPDWTEGDTWLESKWWTGGETSHRNLKILYSVLKVEDRTSGNLEIIEK